MQGLLNNGIKNFLNSKNIIMKSILFVVLFAFAFAFYGCPYYSKVAINEPNIKVDEQFLGNWTVKGGSAVYIVTKLDDYHLKIAQPPVVSKDVEATNSGDTTIYNIHFSKINGISFLNLSQKTKDFTSSDNGYYIYKLQVKGKNEISLTEVTSYIKEQFTSSEKLKTYIEKYMDLSFFFGTETTYIREL